MIPPQVDPKFCSCGRVATIFGSLTSATRPKEELAKIQICEICHEEERLAAEEYWETWMKENGPHLASSHEDC